MRTTFPISHQEHCWYSPETVFRKEAWLASDVWGAGTMLHELLTGGEHVFKMELEASDQDLPDEVESFKNSMRPLPAKISEET